MQDHYTAYDRFAWFFNRYWGNVFAEEVRPIFEERLLPCLPPGGRILDLCCGTGQLSHWLTVCGFEVTGLDSSEEMIHFARRNAPKADFVVADARCFELPARYDAVVSTFDSLNHIPSLEGLFQTFQNVHNALSEDGLFFFDINTDEGFRATAPATFTVVKKTHVCIVQSSYSPRSGRAKSAVTLFELDDGAWRRSDLEILEYCYSEADIRTSLAEAGFQDLVSYDAEKELGMERGAGRLFWLASKGKGIRRPQDPAA